MCIKYENDDVIKAKEALISSGYTCVICKGEVMYPSFERGVKPLLNWIDEGLDFNGFSAADKVVGNGVAFLYVLLGVKSIYSPVMSESAIRTLESHGVELFYDNAVQSIQNRTNTGICPMEEAVMGVNAPDEAIAAIRSKVKMLMQNNN